MTGCGGASTAGSYKPPCWLCNREDSPDGPAPAYPGAAHAVSFLPPSDTTLERFVREARLARREGEAAVQRRDDDTRLEDAR